jgi:hypothetical protein
VKEYPSIQTGCIQRFRAHVFDKTDGSNLRFEWTKKRGWFKYGTRTRLFDESDPVFGSAMELFHNGLAGPIADIAKTQRWDKLVVFAEFHGPHSFAGIHLLEDPKILTLFDASPLRKGILPPAEFLKLFGDLEIAKFLGIVDWNRDYADQVRRGEVEGVTFEGVVAKGMVDRKLVMEKAKTRAWVDKVKALHTLEEAKKILES